MTILSFPQGPLTDDKGVLSLEWFMYLQKLINDLQNLTTMTSQSGITQFIPGNDGNDGDEGPPGPPGASGVDGVNGVNGVSIPGQDGDDGRDGFTRAVNAAPLSKTDDTNVTMTLGGEPLVSLLAPTSLTLGWTGQLGLTRGGTAASLVASNGGIVYSTGSALAILSGTATAGQIVRSGASAAPTWSTATYPATAGTAGKALISDGTNFVSSTPTFPNASATLGKIIISDGTNWIASTPTYPNAVTVNQVLYGTGANAVGSSANMTFDGTTFTVTGNLSVSGNTVIGDAGADTLTINAGTWTIGNNVVATRASGTVATGSVVAVANEYTFTGDAGGATQYTGPLFRVTSQGANAISASRATNANGTHSGTNTLTNMRVFDASGVVSSSGNVTTLAHYDITTPQLSSTGVVGTMVGFNSRDIGHATLVTNALGFRANDITASATLTAGFQGAVTSGTAKWNAYMSGSADNAFAGNVRIGSVVAPTVALDVTGAVTVSGTATLNGDTVIGNSSTDALTVAPNAVTWSNNPTHSGNHTWSGNMTMNGNNVIGNSTTDTLTVAPNAVTWSGNPTHSGNHTYSGNITINGNTVIGDSTTDTLTVAPNAVTWSGNPTHSGNHTFSGNATVNGNTVIGNSATDTLTIAPNAVTWSNNPTHSANHTFSGTVAAASVYAGTTSAVTSANLQCAATGGGAIVDVARFSNDNSASAFRTLKSRNTSIGSHTIVQDGDSIMSLYGLGSDGVAFQQAGEVRISVDGTPGVGDMPGRMDFYVTPDGSATPAIAFTIRQDKAATFASTLTIAGTTTPQALVDISGASAGQVKFPATQNASSNANTLDDYEEGTWTPVLSFATAGDSSFTYSVQNGTYTKIGRQVSLNFTVTTSAFTHTTASGNLQITGLPFTSLTLASHVWVGTGRWQGITKANYTHISPRLQSNSSTIIWSGSGSAQALSQIVAADTPTGGNLAFAGTIVYETA